MRWQLLLIACAIANQVVSLTFNLNDEPPSSNPMVLIFRKSKPSILLFPSNESITLNYLHPNRYTKISLSGAQPTISFGMDSPKMEQPSKPKKRTKSKQGQKIQKQTQKKSTIKLKPKETEAKQTLKEKQYVQKAKEIEKKQKSKETQHKQKHKDIQHRQKHKEIEPKQQNKDIQHKQKPHKSKKGHKDQNVVKPKTIKNDSLVGKYKLSKLDTHNPKHLVSINFNKTHISYTICSINQCQYSQDSEGSLDFGSCVLTGQQNCPPFSDKFYEDMRFLAHLQVVQNFKTEGGIFKFFDKQPLVRLQLQKIVD